MTSFPENKFTIALEIPGEMWVIPCEEEERPPVIIDVDFQVNGIEDWDDSLPF